MSKSNLNWRQIIGDSFLILASVLVLGLLALPYMVGKTSGYSMGSCYDLVGNIGDYAKLGNAALTATGVMLIFVVIVACIVLLLAIVDLVSSILGKKFNTTFINRIMSIAMTVLSVLALICLIAFIAPNSGFEFSNIGTGIIMAIVFSVVAVIASFISKTKKAKK